MRKCAWVVPLKDKRGATITHAFQKILDESCSKLMINEIGCSRSRSENVYLANNWQTSIAVFTAPFCFTHAEHNSIKLK